MHSDYLVAQDLVAQDTFYVGNFKSVGRIYRQTFIDTYDKVAHCKLYAAKTPITAADALNDKVLPFYAGQGLPCCAFLQTAAPSIAAKWSSMIISFTE